MGLGDGDSDLHRYDWKVNKIDGPTKLVRQDAILGGLSIGELQCLTYFYFRCSTALTGVGVACVATLTMSSHALTSRVASSLTASSATDTPHETGEVTFCYVC